ncbi:MAG: 30S ribosome-binding factor RbfA [Acutalibacteraceae bacterium]
MKIKTERVNSELQRQIAKIIANDIKDPRLGSCIVSVTKVSTTPDLKYAKVYLSVYASTEEERISALDTVKRSKTFIRNMLKDAVQIRLLPELNFILDTSVDYGMKIDSLLAKIEIPPEEDSTEK